MRVLHVLVSMAADAGGPAACVQGLTAALAGHDVQCEIATTHGGRTKAEPLPTPGVRVHGFPLSPLARLWNAHSPALARFLADNAGRFDAIHIHEPWHYPGFAAWRIAQRHGIASVLSTHGGLGERALANKRWRKQAYMGAVQRRMLDSQLAVHVLTPVEAADIARQGVAAPVLEAPNGVPVELLSRLDRALADGLLRRFPQLRDKQVVLFLGRVVAGKGPELLAQCFTALADRFPDAALLVAGPPEEADTQRRMHAVLAEAGALHRVAFAGLLTGDDKLGALALARIFVLPSRFEGFPIAPVEAIAAGVPAVISEHCNFPEVAEADAGFVLPLEEAAFATAIETLLADPDRCAAMGANGKRLAAERFAWDAIAKSFAELYRRVSLHEPDGAPQ